jgi:hypothetical protein
MYLNPPLPFTITNSTALKEQAAFAAHPQPLKNLRALCVKQNNGGA